MSQNGASNGSFDAYMSHQLNNEYKVIVNRFMTELMSPVPQSS
jgi:hypothetical protein